MQVGINKMIKHLEGGLDQPFTDEQTMRLATNMYTMCNQKAPHDLSELLYPKYLAVCKEFAIRSLALVQALESEDLLFAMCQRWKDQQSLVKWLSSFMSTLNRHYVVHHCLLPLQDAGLTFFRDLVYSAMKVQARDAVLRLIEREQEGEDVNHTLIKSVVSMFVEVGLGSMDCYTQDLEELMLEATVEYYQKKVDGWVEQAWPQEQMFEAEEHLRLEGRRLEGRRAHLYMHTSSEAKLLQCIGQGIRPESQHGVRFERSGLSALN